MTLCIRVEDDVLEERFRATHATVRARNPEQEVTYREFLELLLDAWHRAENGQAEVIVGP